MGGEALWENRRALVTGVRSNPKLRLTLDQARRLALSGQRLGTAPSPVGMDAITHLVQDLGYLQRDPLAVVAPSHLLVLWSRLGNFDRSLVDRALWQDRSLFEYWAHAASIVPTADFAVHRWFMRNYATGDTLRERRLRDWLQENRPLTRRILTQLRTQGPLPASALDSEVKVRSRSGGWSEGGDVERLLFHLWRAGRVMVAGRDSRGRCWELTERWLPKIPVPASKARLTAQVAEQSLRALGLGTANHIRDHIGAGRQGRLEGVLERLLRRGQVLQVEIAGTQGLLPGRWFLHSQDLARAERLSPASESPWTTLLSPFDNLIIERRRTQLLFDFDFSMEIYMPQAGRRFGYYVLPILQGERLIGRVDARRDRNRDRLIAVSVFAEPGAPDSAAAGAGIRQALERLASFVGVGGVEVGRLVGTPRTWGRPLRS
jgi:hypothetical protein